jgi:hypothetical protein
VTLSVVDRDDRLRIESTSASEIVILGYDGEPYLRVTRDGVFRNVRSPATYLNEDRFANVELPAVADPKAEPEWEKIAAHPRYEWHDHRIHWMSPIDPPEVRASPDATHHVFDWEVPGTVDGTPFTIEGALEYVPVASSRPSWIYLPVPLAALVLVGVGLTFYRRRGRAVRVRP